MREIDTCPTAHRRGDRRDHGLALIRQATLRATTRRYPVSSSEQDELTRKRAEVQRLLTAELDVALRSLGYERDGGAWRKVGAFARGEFQFQKSQHGFDCYFNAGIGPRWPAREPTLHRLARFCPEMAHEAPDALPYVRLHDDPPYRAAIMTVIRARMIPWMEAQHGLLGLARRLAPEDMRHVRIFEDD